MKISIFLIFFFYSNIIFAQSIKCNFEEVYKDGSIQKGLFLLKNDKLRYQYSDPNLFTLIFDNKKLYLTKNKDLLNSIEQSDNDNLIKSLMEIYQEYPNIKSKYIFNTYEVNIERNKNNKFIKRLSVKSNKINLSIYLIDCDFKPINDLFFRISPVFKY